MLALNASAEDPQYRIRNDDSGLLLPDDALAA